METTNMTTTTMSTRYGTSYFPTWQDAATYYKPYVKAEQPHGWFTATTALVKRKVAEGEIHIGKPPVKPGQRLYVADNRWHVEECNPEGASLTPTSEVVS